MAATFPSFSHSSGCASQYSRTADRACTSPLSARSTSALRSSRLRSLPVSAVTSLSPFSSMVPAITSDHQDAPRQSLHHFAELVDRCICSVHPGLLVAQRIRSSLPLGAVKSISCSHDMTPFSSTNILADDPPSNLPAAGVIPSTPRASFPSHLVLCYLFRLAPVLSRKSIKGVFRVLISHSDVLVAHRFPLLETLPDIRDSLRGITNHEVFTFTLEHLFAYSRRGARGPCPGPNPGAPAACPA